MRSLGARRRSSPRLESAASESRPAGSRNRRPLVAAGAVVLVVLVLVSAAAPTAAAASGILGTGISIPNPISLIGSGVSSLLGGLGGDIAKLAVGAFEAIIRALFAPIARFITTQLIGWVITVPNLTQGNVTRSAHAGAGRRGSAAMNVRAARKRVERDPSAAGALLDEVAADLANAVDELRELARGIHPALLTDGGIEPAIRGLVRRSAVPALLLSAPSERYSAEVEATAYFVVAEALTNAARHANATLVEIAVTTTDGALCVEVRDDGIGGADRMGGGLRGLGDRVAVLDGTFEVSSPPQVGTTVKAVLPCAS
jgi:signal transduction histidine kinase